MVSSGDLSLLSPDLAADRATAHQLHRLLVPPVRIVPGNHDVGEIGAEPWGGFGVTSDRVAAFSATFGPDHWLEFVGHWAVIGLDSEVMSSGLPEERAQWEWLAELPSLVGDRPVIVFLHKPLWSPVDGPNEYALSVTDADRERVLSLLDPVDLRAVGSGHLHRFHAATRGEVLTVTAPSSAFVAKSLAMGPGVSDLGVIEYECGEREVSARFLTIPTLEVRQTQEIEAFVATWEAVGPGPMPGPAPVGS